MLGVDTKGATLLVLAAIGSASCGGAETKSALEGSDQSVARIASSDVDLNLLEKSAEEACGCTRSGGDKGTCWREFETRKNDIIRQLTVGEDGDSVEGTATACAPVSTELQCFEFSDGTHCVVTGYHANGASESDRDVMVCRKEEAQAIERASRAAFHHDGKFIGYDDEEAWTRANRESREAIDRVMAAIRRGESFPEANENVEGCV